ncbi:peptidase inhibitor family I36 protein [Mesorhizobium sp. ES1-4]|uniref:peptidase inhibitor family I36 protein n=1 Tax=Mesorhizobium sp. ES1-4 TaxID=2876627 RepID=UPI001CCF19E9|nr:peptidase inhibitor family I36 protein [Mesorhizobium sp. ES1-4]MBZ9798069.1 peptidase inhibitor family I36 protein [Mesorhizobium sp. ES1-4]
MKRLAILAAVASVIFVDSASAQYNDQPACVMFEHVNFRGRSIEMQADDSVSFRGGQFWNDRVSSVFVRRGCSLIAYEDARMGGRSIEIRRRARQLGDYWNDRISSAECVCDGY